MQKTKVIKSLSDLEPYKKLIEEAHTLAVDTETTGLKRYSDAIGISLSPNSEIGIYIPLLVYTAEKGLFNPWSHDSYVAINNWLHKELHKSVRLIGHNVPFDVKIIENTLGWSLIDKFKADTALIHHTIDENPPHGLKPLAVKYIGPEADAPQKDLEESVKANGGSWKASDKEFFKADVDILGNYACYDTIYTYRLYEILWPQIEKEGLTKLWETEVWPLCKVSYELNTTGFDVNIPYYEQLKKDIHDNIETIEDEMYAQIEDDVKDYEIDNIIKKSTFTKRSKLGKALTQAGWEEGQDVTKYGPLIHKKFLEFKKQKRFFNFGSNDDKAFLLFDVLGLPEQGTTKSGKRQVTAGIINKLAEDHAESSEVLQLLLKRNKEAKLLGTYVESVLSNNEDGRIYTSFNQTGTTSGRYSSSKPINFQNLPRDDSRIKRGFQANEGYVLIAADYSSLEPRCFSVVANDKGIKEIFWNDLDFYSKLYIDTFNETEYSADPRKDNYLGTLDKSKRQMFKAIALGIPYGMHYFKLASILNNDPEESKKIIDAYLKAYPNLADWMKKTEFLGRKQGYIESIVGRRRRCPLLKALLDNHGIKNFSKKDIERVFRRNSYGYEDAKKLYAAVRNESNNIKNFQIQSLASSIVNEAMVEFTRQRGNLDAKLVSTIHDEVIVMCKEEQAEGVAHLLQKCMEDNRITRMLDVKMLAEPIIGPNLAEVK